MRNVLFYFLYTLLLLLPCLEIALRILQYQAYQHQAFRIASDPAFCLLPHHQLGFALNPGEYEVRINQGLTYTVTHDADSLRTCGTSDSSRDLPILALLGCSYTYGIGISDSQSYGFLLQSLLPQFHVKNYAVPGYGTVQSYLQLQKMIRNDQKPEIAVIHFADFHHDRNALTPIFRKTLHMGYERSHQQVPQLMQSSRVPYIREDSILWENWANVYQNWPGRENWPTVHFLQEVADRIQLHQLAPEAQSEQIFSMIQEFCQLHNIRLVVVGLNLQVRTQRTLQNLQQKGLETLDLSLDLTNSMYNNFPFDTHPNAIAHQHFAVNLQEYLCSSSALIGGIESDLPTLPSNSQ